MSHNAENDRYGFLSSDGYPEEGPNPLIKPPPSAENGLPEAGVVSYRDEPDTRPIPPEGGKS